VGNGPSDYSNEKKMVICTEKIFGEPKMVLLKPHYETFLFKSVVP